MTNRNGAYTVILFGYVLITQNLFTKRLRRKNKGFKIQLKCVLVWEAKFSFFLFAKYHNSIIKFIIRIYINIYSYLSIHFSDIDIGISGFLTKCVRVLKQLTLKEMPVKHRPDSLGWLNNFIDQISFFRWPYLKVITVWIYFTMNCWY